MIEDFRFPACPDTFEADLCIAGAGPAGITIAVEFANTPWKVCLLESGGLRSERESQSLSEGLSVGPCPLDPAISRLRAFGGSARIWGGGVIPLDPFEMARRDWVPDSGWPTTGVVDTHCRVHGIDNLTSRAVRSSPPVAGPSRRSPSSPSRCGSPTTCARGWARCRC